VKSPGEWRNLPGKERKRRYLTMGLQLLDVIILTVMALKLVAVLVILRLLATEPMKAETKRQQPPSHANRRYNHVLT